MEDIRVFSAEEHYTDEDFKAGTILLIDKPLTWSSFDVVNKIRILFRKHLGIKKIKVGHAGTLDPLATGLLMLCTGKATREISKLTGMEKEYVAKITFGATTPSYDLETEVDERFETAHINNMLIEETLKNFIGIQMQVPPLFSAIKMDGQRAYYHARKGRDVEMSQREVEISELELLDFSSPVATVRMVCSKGTYVRSFAADLGKALKSGAHLSGLIRTASGHFRNENALSPESFEKLLAKK